LDGEATETEAFGVRGLTQLVMRVGFNGSQAVAEVSNRSGGNLKTSLRLMTSDFSSADSIVHDFDLPELTRMTPGGLAIALDPVISVWHSDGRYMAFGRSDEYAITLLDLESGRVTRLGRDVAVSIDERALEAEAEQSVAAGLEIFEHGLPRLVGTVVTSQSGLTAIRRGRDLSDQWSAAGLGNDYDVFSCHGSFLGVVRFPDGFRLRGITKGKALGISSEADGTPVLVASDLPRELLETAEDQRCS
jgi:hypothetical protein